MAARKRKWKEKGICLLTTECMQMPKYYVQMDLRCMPEILIFGLKSKTLLALDNALTHNKINVEILKECEIAISMMLSGFTLKLQPLDIRLIKF